MALPLVGAVRGGRVVARVVADTSNWCDNLMNALNHARAKIPAALHAETPIFLMATAGLRMVGEKAKDEILASVCAELSSSGFLFRCD